MSGETMSRGCMHMKFGIGNDAPIVRFFLSLIFLLAASVGGGRDRG